MLHFLLDRPIAVCTATLALGILGGVALGLLPVSFMPEVDIPEITVQVSGEDRSARELEETMVAPLRRQLLQAGRLDDMQSETRDGSALIRLRFTFGTNIDYAFLDVNELIDRLMGQLPRDLPRPNVVKASVSDFPVFFLSVRYRDSIDASVDSDRLLRLGELVETVIRKRIEQLSEVAMVDITGRDVPELQIIPHINRLQSLGLGYVDIEQALAQYDLQPNAILLREGQYQYNVRMAKVLHSANDLSEIYLRKGERLFQLKELADIRLASQAPKGRFLHRGHPALNLAIIQQGGSRIADLRQQIDQVLDQLRRQTPELVFELNRDQSRLLEASIQNLSSTLLWGVLLASLITGLCLREFRAALIIGISLPISLLISVLIFYLVDLSLNVISLSGLVLGIGLMIDNGIIVIDSITDRRSSGDALDEACINGTREVLRPLISSACTTAAVFLPLVLLSGISGALFADQAMAVTIGLGSSLGVAIMVLPVVYAQVFRHRSSSAPGMDVSNFLYRPYKRGFDKIMRRPAWLGIAIGVLIMAGCYAALSLPIRQLPMVSHDDLIVQLDWNEPLTLAENERRMRKLLNALAPQLSVHQAQLGEQQFLLDPKPRQQAAQAELYLQTSTPHTIDLVREELFRWLARYAPRAQVSVAVPPTIFDRLFREQDRSLEARLSYPNGQEIPTPAQTHAFIQNLSQVLEQPIPPPPLKRLTIIHPSQEALLYYGVSMDRLLQTLSARAQSSTLRRLDLGRNSVPVVLRERYQGDWLERPILTDRGQSVPLRALVDLQPGEGYQALIGGENGLFVPLYFDIAEAQLTQHKKALLTAAHETDSSLDITLTGSLLDQDDLVWELIGVLASALCLLYAILTIQFESLSLPLIVLLEVPIDIAASLVLLWATGQSLNLMAMIGMIVMIGIIINDSILKIDTINRLRREGLPMSEALLEAGRRRLRPIVMTSATTILAVVPFSWGAGLGNELQAPLAIALIGGMAIGTLISLYFIPLAYKVGN